jgi:Cu2+-exporting ATPase
VQNVHCAGCIDKIESTLKDAPGVTAARVNLSTGRLHLAWRHGTADPARLVALVNGLGYPAAPFDPARLKNAGQDEERFLLRCLAVAGFAAANVMLLSVSIWAGAFSDMGPATRTLFHWLSALIALPAIVYAGRPFFRSALSALRARNLNMDVPISVAVLLASGMSLFETMHGGDHAYFDAAVTLVFFLLVGRYLDRRARGKAHAAAEHLLALSAKTATVIESGGTHRPTAVSDILPGMRVFAAAGDAIAVDGIVRVGTSQADTALVTGESLPARIAPGDKVFAGTINLDAPIEIDVTAAGDETLLAEIVRLMEAAEQGRAKYVRLADRVARLYAPVVHALALAAFLGWITLGGLAWQPALMIAVAVLIITCPCALGLAVPVVQVVASGRLLKRGILLKAADGLERLAKIDTVVFDKTGTLTMGRPALKDPERYESADLRIAAALARHSRHPLSRAVVRAGEEIAGGLPALTADAVRETPGRGLEGNVDGRPVRLGKGDWCNAENMSDKTDQTAETELWLNNDGRLRRFVFTDTLRADARAVVAALRADGYAVELLSGDREHAVAAVATETGIESWRASCLPREKVARLQALADAGRRVLMIGDGLNDAPALAAGYASMSPAGAADISQTAADVVFQGAALGPVAETLRIARRTDRLVKQNLALALLYNAVAIPLAVAGFVTPLIAAVAMSASSLTVIVNALRLRLGAPGKVS